MRVQVEARVKTLCGDGYVEPENCFGFVGVAHRERALLLGFRGTHGLLQLIYEARRTVFSQKVDMAFGGAVSEYFYDVYRALLDGGLGRELRRLLAAHPDYEVWVTGHSLGGAMASIAAAELIHFARVPADQVKLVTFGQPRTGDALFSEAHRALVSHRNTWANCPTIYCLLTCVLYICHLPRPFSDFFLFYDVFSFLPIFLCFLPYFHLLVIKTVSQC